MDNIEKALIEHGYPEKIAANTAVNLCKIASTLRPALESWAKSGEEKECEAEGYSTSSLMERFKGMKYPAALLTIDWLLREPQKAKAIIEKGIR